MRAALGYDRSYSQTMERAMLSRQVGDADQIGKAYVGPDTNDYEWESREVVDRDGIWWTFVDVFTPRDGNVVACFWSLLK